jgi:predicted unusual protein kinase regulating ubiquinone biosynthesis (AarF/ABC1/UbiB family)
MNHIYKIFNYILFLTKLSFILSTETLRYYFLQNFTEYIDRLSIKLSSINILYVKLFQAIAWKNNLIDEKINNKLIQFTDNVPWNDSDIDLHKLNDIVEKYDLQLINNYVPINSGMISLVFKCKQKHDDKTMIIKIKRKNIDEKLDESIDNILFSIYILSFIPIIHKYKIDDFINKNIETIRIQTNLLEEIDNMDKIRENCRNLKYVKIPTANRKITEEYNDVIVMDYIEGVNINKIKKEDNEIYAKLLVKFGIVTFILHGITHGDLHSGNILFIKDINDEKNPYKIGIIDFGIIYKYDNKYKEVLVDFITNLFYDTPQQLAIKMLNSFVEPEGILQKISTQDYNIILSFVETIISDVIECKNKKNKLNLYKMILHLNKYISNERISSIGIRVSNDIIKTQLVLAMSHGVLLNLCDDYILLVDNVINELFHTNFLLD